MGEKTVNGQHTILVAGPNPPTATGVQSPLKFQNPINSITGCGIDKISKINYATNMDGSGSQSCGTSNEGLGFDAYPSQMLRGQCTFSYISGTAVGDNNSDQFLANMYFYWQ